MGSKVMFASALLSLRRPPSWNIFFVLPMEIGWRYLCCVTLKHHVKVNSGTRSKHCEKYYIHFPLEVLKCRIYFPVDVAFNRTEIHPDWAKSLLHTYSIFARDFRVRKIKLIF